MDRKKKNIYLTFDDGPVPHITEWVLQELKKANARATFFCVGTNILKNEIIFNKIVSDGHSVANHTMYHSKGFKNGVADYMKEVDDCKKLVQNNLFRPPYGQLKPAQYKALNAKGYKTFFWDVISYDYEKISPQSCFKNVKDHSKNGSIVLFHDSEKAEKNLKYTLPLVLEHFSQLGYRFKTLEE